MTPKSFFEEKLTKQLATDPDKAKALGAIYQFDISGGEGGTWTVDLSAPKVVNGPAGNAQCTLAISDKDFVEIVEKKLNPQMAFMQGRLKVTGNMGLALKLTQIL